MIFPAYIEHM